MTTNKATQPKETITTSDLTHRLFSKFGTDDDATNAKYIVATQVRPNATHGDSTADAVIIGNWPSIGYEIQGFEIKISRTDWLNEVKKPNKCDATKKYCDRWWLLIAAESMVKPGELPDDWGLMVAHGRGIRIVKEAPKLEPSEISVQFVTGLMRANKRAHIAEDLHKQYLADNKRALEVTLRKEYKGLLEFAKVVHEAFGIEFKLNKEWTRDLNNGRGGYENKWVAKIRNKWHEYTPEQLKGIIEAAVSGDIDKSQVHLHRAYDEATKVIEMLEKYKGKSIW
jgi:hypothetical protein